MIIRYNKVGPERKALAGAISQELNAPIKYLGAPTFAYQIGSYQLDKNCILEGEDNYGLVADLCALHDFKAVSEEYDAPLPKAPEVPEFRNLTMTEAEELGLGSQRRENTKEKNVTKAVDYNETSTYRAELSDPSYPDRMEIFNAENDLEAYQFAMNFCKGEVVLLELHELNESYELVRWVDLHKLLSDNDLYDTLEIEISKNGMTGVQVKNLLKLVDSKQALLTRAIGKPLIIKDTGESLVFEFPYDNDNEAGNIYAQFATALIRFVIKKQRVTSVEKKVSSDKFTLRTFLVRLDMNGREYAEARKYLLRKLSGSSAYAKVEG